MKAFTTTGAIAGCDCAIDGAIKDFLGFLGNCFEDVEMKDGKFKQIQAKHA